MYKHVSKIHFDSKICLFYMYVWSLVYVLQHVCVGAHEIQKRASTSLELELWKVLDHIILGAGN